MQINYLFENKNGYLDLLVELSANDFDNFYLKYGSKLNDVLRPYNGYFEPLEFIEGEKNIIIMNILRMNRGEHLFEQYVSLVMNTIHSINNNSDSKDDWVLDESLKDIDTSSLVFYVKFFENEEEINGLIEYNYYDEPNRFNKETTKLLTISTFYDVNNDEESEFTPSRIEDILDTMCSNHNIDIDDIGESCYLVDIGKFSKEMILEALNKNNFGYEFLEHPIKNGSSIFD